MRNPWVRAVIGFAVGLLLFFALAWSLRQTLSPTILESPALSQVVLKTALVVVALLAWSLTRRPFREMGWRSVASWNWSYLIWFLIGGVAMAAASTAMILMDRRHPIAAQMGFLQIVLCVWFLSSISEEIYVRGLIQSWIADGEHAVGAGSVFAPAIVSSALLFAAMHVPLMWTPAGKKGGLTIVIAVLFLGWACAVLRARCKSLWPAIACHIFGNIMGVPGGILGVIVYRILYHRFPDFINLNSH
jgi:membrane protease YdiL (CAAX protease family)